MSTDIIRKGLLEVKKKNAKLGPVSCGVAVQPRRRCTLGNVCVCGCIVCGVITARARTISICAEQCEVEDEGRLYFVLVMLCELALCKITWLHRNVCASALASYRALPDGEITHSEQLFP